MVRQRSHLQLCLTLGLCLHLAGGMTLRAAAQAPGADEPGSSLTLDQAVKKALAGNPRMSAAESQVAASEARLAGVRSGLFPKLDASEEFSRTNNPVGAFSAKLNQGAFTRSDFDPSVLNSPNALNNFATTFSVTLPLFDSGQTWIGLSQAGLGKRAAAMAAARTRQEVIAETVIAYAGVQVAFENLRVVEQALDTARAHLKLVRTRLESGLVVKSDLLRAEVRVAELEQAHLDAQSQVEIAAAALNAAMGFPVDMTFRLTTPLEAAPQVEEALGVWTGRALEKRPDLEQARYRAKMAEEEVSKSKAAHLPSVNLLGNYQINSEDLSDSAESYGVGAMVRFNLFSGYNLQAKVEEATSGLRHAQAMERQMEIAVTVETKQAFLQAQSSWQRIQVAQAAVSQAEEGLRIIRNRYENGLYTIVNLLDAEVALQQARTNHVRALHDYTVARVRLMLAAGVLDESFR
jgi:outer membrane protein